MRSQSLSILKIVFAAFFICVAAKPVLAADLPLAAGSPLAGIAFDDRPLLLPVQRNFQMGMLTASSEIGRSCGKMESYGWRMNQTEQQRVNLIFNNTVDRLRALGYVIETRAPQSVSRDVTIFTADRPDRHFVFMWSAGEIGLVMVLCESSAPLTGRMAPVRSQSAVQTFPPPRDVLQSRLESPAQSRTAREMATKFSPVGDWVGDYTCMQGITGGTLHIDSLKGEDFTGTFRFYPTPKNRFVAKGSYAVYGQYDTASHRVLINPGKWIERPKNYYNTIIVGSFDPAARSFSGFFQGIMGCTSFEAKYSGVSHMAMKARPKKKVKKKARKKTAVPAVTSAPVDTGTAPASTSSTAMPPPSDGIKLPDNSAPSLAPPPASAPVAAPQPPVSPPASGAMPQPTTPAPSPVKPTSMLMDRDKIVIALNQYPTSIQQVQPAPVYNTVVPQVPPAQSYDTTIPQVEPVTNIPLAQQIPPPNYVAPSVSEMPEIPELPLATEISPPQQYDTSIPQVQPAQEIQPPQQYPDP